MNVGGDERIYWVGEKPANVFFSGLTVTTGTTTGENVTFAVFTKNSLQSIGLGYIVRWRSRGWNADSDTEIDFAGPWHTPPSTWTSHTDGMLSDPYFYQAWIKAVRGCFYSNQYDIGIDFGFSSWNEWVAFRNLRSNDTCFRFYHIVEFEIRLVLIENALDIGSMELNETFRGTSFFEKLIYLRNYATSGVASSVSQVSGRVSVKLLPFRTCTTPSIAEATQNFNMVFASAIPNPGNTTAQRGFDFTLTNCPRVNLMYHVHANGKWVNSSQGIVGMSGSTPNANPAIGNPRGFGIQLQHRTGGHQHSGNVYIHPNEVANPSSSQSYTRNWQGAGTTNTSTGVTHIIPLRASVIRTNPANTPIQPGPFTASVVVVIRYP